MRLLPLVVLAAATLAPVRPASADRAPPPPASARPPAFDLGVRLGGYGFKREGDDRPGESWTECRMNGFGVFASRNLRGPLFVEAGIDMYASADIAGGPAAMDLPIDRTSGIVSVAGGVRTQLAPRLRGFIQIGAGVELTRVSVPYGDETIRDTKAMPEGFFGLGLDLRIARRTYFGMNLRTHMMGNFDYSRDWLEQTEEWGFSTPDPAVVFDASLDFAAQGQFYLRRDL
jgi:hypothetical protein